jgi:hypothetical protein
VLANPINQTVEVMSAPQNIDLLFILQPAIVILISFGLVVCWRYKRSFAGAVLLYSFVAYFGAIALKYLVQLPTARYVLESFGPSSPVFALYLGLQTVFFEVGLAFLLAYHGVRRAKLKAKDAEAYGIGLSLWENGVFLGLIPLINLLAIYVILGSNMLLAQTVYSQITRSHPFLFNRPAEVLPLIGWGILERISSTLAHFSWGYLSLVAAAFRKWRYFGLALPMGLLDALVPWAGTVPPEVSEPVLFAITVGFFTVSLAATRELRRKIKWSPTKRK